MRNAIVQLAVVLFAFGAASNQAAAQQPPQPRRPPPEVAIGVTRFFPTFGDFTTDSLAEGSAELRVTVPFTPRFAAEGIGTIGQRGNEYWNRTEGLYLVQIRQRLRRTSSSPFQPFITYGAAGYYAHVSQRDVLSYNEIDEPYAIAVGAGFQQRLANFVAVRADAQLLTFFYLPLGYRFSTSVSIPLGRYSTN